MIKSALIANGQIDNIAAIKPLLKGYSRIIAVDGGLRYCKAMGVQPTLIVGDFDSAPKDLVDEYTVPKIALKTEKDETDLEIAIGHEMNLGSTHLTVFGGWGGRMDHSLTNALLLARSPGQIQMETEQEVLFAIEKAATIPCKAGQTLSLLPMCGAVTGIMTKGLKWELKNGALGLNFIGISNVCLQSEVFISIEEGILLCSLSKY